MRSQPIRRPRAVLTSSLLLFAGLLVPGCGAPPPDPALVAYRQVFAAVGRDDVKMFVAGLTPSARDRLRAQFSLSPTAPEEALVGRLDLRPGASFEIELPKDAKVVEGEGDPRRRIVEGPLDGAVWRIPVVKVGQSWRVDLFEAKKMPPTLGTN